MNTPGNTTRTPTPVRQPVLLGLFTGTAIGAGYLFAGVPNVELMTLIIALSGGVLGARLALAAGVLAAIVYSLGSPYGLPVPVMLLAQAAGMGTAGILGAWGGNLVRVSHFKKRHVVTMLWAALIGLGSTLIYDLLTNLAIIWAFDTNPAVVMTGAVPFVLLHVGSNVAIFIVLFPLLLVRLTGLNRAALVGRTSLLLVVLVGLATPDIVKAAVEAPADSTSLPAPTRPDSVQSVAEGDTLSGPPVPLTGPEKAFGWQRPLWQPFAPTALEWLNWNSSRVPVIDGGLGAPAMILGEAGTSWNPQFVRDDIPLGTGHLLADDPWLVPTAGLTVSESGYGADGWGGSGGLVETRTEDPDPEKAVSSYRGVKGKHETYFRSIYLLTPKAAWRAAFEFEESLDIEGYNFTELPDENFAALNPDGFTGHSRLRQSRTRLFRELDADNRLIIEYGNARLTKDSLPTYGAEHLELWDDALAATMETGLGNWHLATNLFWRDRDVVWGDRGVTSVVGVDSRKLETGRGGLSLALSRPRTDGEALTGLRLQATQWSVDDTLTPEAWLADFDGSGNGEGQTARITAHTGARVSGLTAQVNLGADWHSHAGTTPEIELLLGAGGQKPWWTATAWHGGRAPRSDELLTPLLRDVAGRQLSLYPNADLTREKTTRLGLVLQMRALGFDLAVDGSATRLRDGITWQALPGETDKGTWQNALAMNSRRITGTVGRQGRFLGWARVMLEGTWQNSDEQTAQATFLPPERYLRTHLMWENHFFQEDGILQVALLSTVQGEMADPWDVTRTAPLPSRTVHDLLLGFRLVGAHLTLGIKNLTGERTRLTSGALSTGQEVDMRLHWDWLY